MTHSRVCLSIVVASAWLLVTVAAGPADAQQPTPIGGKGDWSAYTFVEEGNKVCYMASTPKQSKGNYTRRGNIYALVTNRPAESLDGVVSFVTGYTFEKDSSVAVAVDGADFVLFTSEDRAWSPDQGTDQSMVSAMKKGSTMVVKGTSSRGTLTTDTYSLTGFTATKDLIDQECGG